MPTLQELCESGKIDMSQDFLSQQDVDALLKGVKEMNLVEELRARAFQGRFNVEAADEIERLSAENKLLQINNIKFLEINLENERLQSKLAAVRELMNCYNIGGWTDAVAPMERALKAEAELAICQKDAERYQWLRHGDNDEKVISYLDHGEAFLRRNEKLDAAIDSAMEKQNEPG